MLVHHLDGALLDPPFMRGTVAHVLLVEHPTGLVLVDTGIGRADHASPERLGPVRHLLRPRADGPTAIGGVEALGFSADDVTDVVMTHLDFDHCGGLADVPHARVHTTADEHAAVFTSPDWHDKRRYRRQQLDHEIRWELHAGRGDLWRGGLSGHEVLPGITLVPMPGHSRGHAAVAVESDRGLLIHAGDAVFDASHVADVSPSARPLKLVPLMRSFERVVGRDQRAIGRNHAALRALGSEPDVTVFPAHDARMLRDLRSAAGGR